MSRKTVDLSHWWTVFNDPSSTNWSTCAYRQNLTLKEAGFRILQARANWASPRADLFPQPQDATGGYRRVGVAAVNPSVPGLRVEILRPVGFRLQPQLGTRFLGPLPPGRSRRPTNSLDASVDDYDDVLVTLLGDVASNYVQIRTDQERIALLQANVELQRGVLDYHRNAIQGRLTAKPSWTSTRPSAT